MNNSANKSALVVEGGGMRGIFAAGVLHAFGSESFDPFDLYIGVSAGACYLASHLAGQNDRNLDITLQYSTTADFINPWRFLRGGHLISSLSILKITPGWSKKSESARACIWMQLISSISRPRESGLRKSHRLVMSALVERPGIKPCLGVSIRRALITVTDS